MNLTKFFSIIIALFLTHQVVAQNLFKELVFFNNSATAINIGGTVKSARRAPAYTAKFPVCYYDELGITLISDCAEYILPFSILDKGGYTLLSGVVTITPNQTATIDLSFLPIGVYQLIMSNGKEYSASFERTGY